MSSNSSNDTNGTEIFKKYHTQENDSAVILFIFGSCAVGALVRRLIQGLNLRLPYTVVLLVLGVLFGLLSSRFAEVHLYATIVEADPHLILTIFLPVLIFESAFAMEVHTFLKAFIQVIILAIPGFALAALLTCVLARYLFTYEWDWNEGMMFGSILSATDPVAVVALLREIGASKQMAMIVEGESLLNDGAAIVFFNVFFRLANSDSGMTGGDIVLYFLQVSLGGTVWGYVMAKISLFWLSRIFNDALAEITITLVATYLTYYIGEEFFSFSGVLAVVVLGVVMSAERTMISPEVEHFLHRFWETLAYLANTLIFIIVGMVIAEKAIFEIHGIDWFYMFSLYFGLFVIRGLVIAIFSPILRHTGYGMSWKEGIVMTWGGLRGAVGLALALQVAHNDTIDQETVGVRVLIHVSGIVFLTLIVNATTVYGLLKLLGMSDLSPAKRMAMANALRYLEDMREKTLNMLKTDRFLADADWATVEKTSEIPDPYMTTEEEADVDESLDFKENAVCPDCDHELPPQYTRKDLRDMTNEAILRMLKAEKMSYWRQFEQGMLSREATRKLQECTDVASDKKGRSIDVEDIKKCWEVPKIQVKLKRLVKKFIVSNSVDVPKNSLLKPIHRLVNHKAFYCAIFVIIVIDMINSASSVASLYVRELYQERDIFRSFNVIFVVIYIVEAVIKRLVQKKDYMQNPWNVISLVIISLGLIDIILSFTLPAVYGESNDTINVVLLVFILQRFSRIFRLVQPLMPIILNLIKRRMSQHLSYGFDVGRGYAAGEEEVRKLIDHMVDHKEIAKSLKKMSDNGRLEVIRCLGMLSKQHPDIALSIKTRQAIRSVLNQVRDGIHELMEDGILEEAEGAKLEKIVEEKMKRLLNAPPSLPIPAPDKMLNNVFWLQKDPELIAYIKDKAKLLSYNFEDVIMKQGDPPGGIYIIVSGMVRLESSNTSGKQKVSFQDKSSGSTKQSESDLLDFLMSGNIIGEMGLLTNKPRSATIVCETSVQVLFISLEDMVHAMEKFSGGEQPLEYRLWHVCANRIAVNILTNQPTYQGWTKEKIKLRLENSYLASLENNVFAVDSSMSDVVLVNGQAVNPFTEELFEGPCYVPWTVFKLDILPNQKPKCVILVIPSELGQPVHSHSKVSHEDQRGHGAFINTISKLCLRHASQHRLNLESKWRFGSYLVAMFIRNALPKMGLGEWFPLQWCGFHSNQDGKAFLISPEWIRQFGLPKVQMAKSMGTLFSMQKIGADGTSGRQDQFSNGLVGDGYPLGPRASTPGRLQKSFCNDAFIEEEEAEEVESTTGSESAVTTSVSALQVAVTSTSRSMANEYVAMPGSNSNMNNNTNTPKKQDHSLGISTSKSWKRSDSNDSWSLNQEMDLVQANEQFQNHSSTKLISPPLEIVQEENEAQTKETKGAKTTALKRVSDPGFNFSNRRSPESTQIFGWETQYWKQFLSTSAQSPTGSLTSTSSKSSFNDKGTLKTKDMDQNDASMASDDNLSCSEQISLQFDRSASLSLRKKFPIDVGTVDLIARLLSAADKIDLVYAFHL